MEYGINGESLDKILHTIDRINLHGIRIKFHDIALSRNSTTAKFYSKALEKLWGPLINLEDTEYNLSSNTIYDLEQGNILSAIERLKKYFETHTFQDIKNYEDSCFLLGYIYTHIETNLEYAIYYINSIDDRIYKNMILGNIYYLQEKFTQAIEAFENSDFNHASTIGFSSESRKRLMECYFEAHKYKNIRALFRKEIKALIENPLQKFNFSGKQYYILWYALKDQPNYKSDQFYFLMNSKMKNYAPASYAYGQKFAKEDKIDNAIENYTDSSNYLPSMMALARIYSNEEKYEQLWFANLHHAHKKGHADATYQLALDIKKYKKEQRSIYKTA